MKNNKEISSSKKKEINSIKAKAKFRGLRLWPKEDILKMCQVSYPNLGLEKVIGFIDTDKGKQIFLVEGTKGDLIISDAG